MRTALCVAAYVGGAELDKLGGFLVLQRGRALAYLHSLTKDGRVIALLAALAAAHPRRQPIEFAVQNGARSRG